MTDTLEIGELVEWTVGKITRKGIFKQIINGKAEIICTEAGDTKMSLRVEVELELVKRQHAGVA